MQFHVHLRPSLLPGGQAGGLMRADRPNSMPDQSKIQAPAACQPTMALLKFFGGQQVVHQCLYGRPLHPLPPPDRTGASEPAATRPATGIRGHQIRRMSRKDNEALVLSAAASNQQHRSAAGQQYGSGCNQHVPAQGFAADRGDHAGLDQGVGERRNDDGGHCHA